MCQKFLASAVAVVLCATAANAADLNKPAKAAVDYVKICNAYGAGFFYIPGSDTCLKISGFVYGNTEFGTANTVRPGIFSDNLATSYAENNRGKNVVSTYVKNQFFIDARTNTDYGLLRSFTSFNIPLGTSAGNTATSNIRLDNGFVQFGGLTAGRAATQFGFYSSDVYDFNYGQISYTNNVNQLAYTFALGNGFSATASIEDPTTAGSLSAFAGNYSSFDRRGGFTFAYGALNAPDFVGNVDVTQAWGEARIGVAAHQDYGQTAAMGTKWGYAAEASVKFLLPQLGAGDNAGLVVAAGRGATGYVNDQAYVINVGNTNAGTYDLGLDAVSGNGTKLTNAWSVFGGVTHNFSPMWELDTALGYYSASNSGTGVNGFAGGTTGSNAFAYGQTEGSVILKWKPVTGFFVSPYTEFRNASFSQGTINNYSLLTKNAWTIDFGLRFFRSF